MPGGGDFQCRGILSITYVLGTLTVIPAPATVESLSIETIKLSALLDALGRELDGNISGQPGANFTAVLSKTGASVTSAKALDRVGGLSLRAVDAVLEAGLRTAR